MRSLRIHANVDTRPESQSTYAGIFFAEGASLIGSFANETLHDLNSNDQAER